MPDVQPLALVTGASGFIGGHVVETLLRRGWQVRCLVRRSSSLRWLPADRIELAYGTLGDVSGGDLGEALVRDSALQSAAAGARAVFHLAALTSAARDDHYIRVNVDGTRSIARAVAAAAPDATLVFCSSLAAGGPARGGKPAREDDPPRPVSAYGRSKLAAEHALLESGVRHVVVRPPAVYGPRDTDILAGFRLAKRGLAMRLAPAGQELSLVHARDLAEGLVTAAEQAGRPDVTAARIYHMTDGVVHTWEELIETIGASVGRRPRVVAVPPVVLGAAARADRLRARLTGRKPLLTPDRALELRQGAWTCDDSRARALLGYESRITLEEGVAETADWYRREGWL